MNACEIKKILLNFFKFSRGADIVCTEVENKDVVAVFQKYITEVEIKISEKDFLRDFKKPKHKKYEYLSMGNTAGQVDKLIPNKFYYAVPESIKEFVLKYLSDIKKNDCLSVFNNYGVICFDYKNIPYVARQGKIFCSIYSEKLKREVVKRVSTEYMNFVDFHFSITKHGKYHKKVYDSVKSYLSIVLSCSECVFYSNCSDHCKLYLTQGKDLPQKKGCKYLFDIQDQETTLNIPPSD